MMALIVVKLAKKAQITLVPIMPVIPAQKLKMVPRPANIAQIPKAREYRIQRMTNIPTITHLNSLGIG